MDRQFIESIIPHRSPFLMVDEIVELEPGKRAVGIKRIYASASCLPGERCVQAVPPVLLLESMAQIGAVAVLSLPGNRGKITLLTGIENARFYTEVLPGEEIRVEAEIVRMKGRFGRRRCRAAVGGNMVAEAEILFALANING